MSAMTGLRKEVLRLLLPGAALLLGGPATAQTNTSCTTALPLECGVQQVDAGEYVGCLWFYFELDRPQHVRIVIPGHMGARYVGQANQSECGCEPSGMVQDVVVDEVLTVIGSGPQRYYFSVYIGEEEAGQPFEIQVVDGEFAGCRPDCEGCLPSFSPLPGRKYIVNAWVREEGAPGGAIVYSKPRITVEMPAGAVVQTIMPGPQSPMVDGWQLMEGEFTAPPEAASFRINLLCNGTGSVLFDDVRIFPAEGSMKCYVYDPKDLRFVAELDERHFATRYEYDNEGKLVRVKKDTERGVMTLQETRRNAPRSLPSP